MSQGKSSKGHQTRRTPSPAAHPDFQTFPQTHSSFNGPIGKAKAQPPRVSWWLCDPAEFADKCKAEQPRLSASNISTPHVDAIDKLT